MTVPTPVDEFKRPDLPLIKASETVDKVIPQGAIVIYESTVYPGATEEFCVSVLERLSGMTLNALFVRLKSTLASNGILYQREGMHRDFRAGDVRHSQADIGKAQRLLCSGTRRLSGDHQRDAVVPKISERKANSIKKPRQRKSASRFAPRMVKTVGEATSCCFANPDEFRR